MWLRHPYPPEVLDRISRSLAIPYCPHRPTTRQALFLLCDDLGLAEVLYGGAAGGGKSDALLMSALRYADRPGYAALILRRTYADLALPGAIMDRAAEWLMPSPARWDDRKKTWTFPSGATLTFGYCENRDDHYRYQGAEFQSIAFDELTQFTELPYRYLFSRLRRLAGSDIPIRMRAASNPGGIGSAWVRKRFLETKAPGRLFIPARLADNPHLDQAAYVQSLGYLDSVERKRLLEGDWWVRREGLVYPELEACVVPDGMPIPEGTPYGGIDFGYNNPFAAVAGVLDHDDVLWIHWERYGRATTLSEHGRSLPRCGGRMTWYADPAGADQIAELRAAGHTVGKAPNAILAGIDRVNHRIRTGRLKVFARCKSLREEAGLYHYDPNKESETPHDRDNHALSALRYLISAIDRGRAVEPAEAPDTGGHGREAAPLPGRPGLFDPAWWGDDGWS